HTCFHLPLSLIGHKRPAVLHQACARRIFPARWPCWRSLRETADSDGAKVEMEKRAAKRCQAEHSGDVAHPLPADHLFPGRALAYTISMQAMTLLSRLPLSAPLLPCAWIRSRCFFSQKIARSPYHDRISVFT